MSGARVIRNLKGENGSNYITDTALHSNATFWDSIQALEATVIATAVCSNMGGTLAAIPIPAGSFIYGLFSAITLTSGKVIAYKKA